MKYILLFVAFAFAKQASCQDHAWLGQVFGEEAYATMLEASPEKLEFYAFLDEHGHQVEDVAPKSVDQYPDALLVESKSEGAPELSLELILSDDFHPMMYSFDREASETIWYRVGDTTYLITFLPLQKVRASFLNAQ